MQMRKKAQKQGSFVIVVDPIYTDTAKQADHYVRIKPGGDGALALAMGKRIIEKGLYDEAYINRYVNGLEVYKAYVQHLDLELLCERAGVLKE